MALFFPDNFLEFFLITENRISQGFVLFDITKGNLILLKLILVINYKVEEANFKSDFIYQNHLPWDTK